MHAANIGVCWFTDDKQLYAWWRRQARLHHSRAPAGTVSCINYTQPLCAAILLKISMMMMLLSMNIVTVLSEGQTFGIYVGFSSCRSLIIRFEFHFVSLCSFRLILCLFSCWEGDYLFCWLQPICSGSLISEVQNQQLPSHLV